MHADQSPAVANPSPVAPAMGTCLMSVGTPTPSMATPSPSLHTPSTVDPKEITPMSQTSQCPSWSHTRKSLNFEMPTQTKTACAAHPASPASSFDSSMQDLGEKSVKRKRGRPHKVPTAPTYDFPKNGTEEEKKKWKRRKNAEKWHYKKLTSEEVGEYLEKEKAQVSIFQLEK